MRNWLRVHRYLGAFCAPMLIFFAISGSWQVTKLHKSRKDGSYTAPRAIALASDMHTADDVTGPANWAFRGILWLVAGSLVVSSSIGLMMAFRLEPAKSRVALLALAGAVLPVVLYLLAHQ